MDLTTFERELRAYMRNSTQLRPFVCEGSPFDCKVFLVGTNPATSMDADWWTFWKPGYGFDRNTWYQEYLKQRLREPLKPGKTRRSKKSNTRRVIEWVIEGASPVRCLETNVFAAPSERVSELGSKQRVFEPFDFVLQAVKPKIVVAHGKDAIAFLSKRHIDFIREDHFSHGWSKQRALELGTMLKDLRL